MASQPTPARLPFSPALIEEAIGAIVAVVASARRRGNADEKHERLAEVALRLQAELAIQEVLDAMGTPPAKGAALIGSERREEAPKGGNADR